MLDEAMLLGLNHLRIASGLAANLVEGIRRIRNL